MKGALLALSLCAAAVGTASAQQSFGSPDDAAQALLSAAAANDTAAMLKLFGPQGKDIVESGDAAEDKATRAEFARRAREKLQVEAVKGNPDRAGIVVGNDNWPVPVPLVRTKGQWHFDAAQGRVEILARRIGRNELAAIDVCRAYVEAQNEYAARDRNGKGMLEYAPKIVSSPGKHDGLYWEGQADNLVPRAFADAAAAMFNEGKKPAPYHGYYFHILKAQGPEAAGGAKDYVVKGMMIGGFALVAFPAEYGVSGVKTFIVNHQGVVYEKDLGSSTLALSRQMTRFNPDKTWKKVAGE
jgi:hypothetical protein